MKPGIHTDISIDDYHADKTWLSATGLKHAAASLAEYRYFLDGGYDDDDKPQFGFGNAFELALLDPAAFEKEVAILQTEAWTAKALEEKPDLKVPKSSKAYKDLAEAFIAANEGKYTIPDVGKESFETIEKMMASCKQDKIIQTLLENIQYQATCCWIDPATQLQMKTRPDLCMINDRVVVNLKTALNASPESFSRDLAKFHYPLQAVTEIIGVESTGLMEKVDTYFWLVVEKNPPHCAVLYEFEVADIETWKISYHFILKKIKEAQAENKWPGYSDRADNKYGILTARIPSWYGVYGM